MYNREEMKEALGKLSWNTVVSLLESEAPAPSVLYDEFLVDVVRTGCLIKKHATAAQRKARDTFKAKLRTLIQGKSTIEQLGHLDAHLRECELIEEAFVTILATVAQCEISLRPIPEQVWAVIERTVAELALLHEKLGEVVIKSVGDEGFAFMSPLNVRINDENGGLVHPDAITNTFIEGMGSAIKLLAHGNFIDGRRIVLPAYLATSEAAQTEAGIHHYYAQAWELVEEGSEHIRYWDEELIVRDNKLAPK